MHPRNSFENGIFGKLESGLSKILPKFNFIFHGIYCEKQKGPRNNYHPLLRLSDMLRSPFILWSTI